MPTVADLKQVHRATWAAGTYAAVAEMIDEAPPRDLLAKADMRRPSRLRVSPTATRLWPER
jgi:hypothetical protein